MRTMYQVHTAEIYICIPFKTTYKYSKSWLVLAESTRPELILTLEKRAKSVSFVIDINIFDYDRGYLVPWFSQVTQVLGNFFELTSIVWTHSSPLRLPTTLNQILHLTAVPEY